MEIFKIFLYGMDKAKTALQKGIAIGTGSRLNRDWMHQFSHS